ncbi:murein hydrolase activator EnvC [Motiliproteus sp. MSK22-1]|uniref:murein hydrolase activator EnvC family protein n=1 Tax=Motiliproteus sp. MSK22-1 TaxID=1897630 RepID=UPI0009F87312|nr:peptidoglycan DD-metalloendopeptidase family protein [Motiliproteus sp. MSK22-1]
MTEKKVRQLQKNIRKLETQLKEFKGESKSLQTALRGSEKKAGKLSQAIRVNQQQISEGQKQLKALAEEQNRLKEAQVEQAEILRKQLLAAYRMGRQDQIKLLLNQKNPERLSRILRYYEYLNRSKIESIALYQQTLASLTDVEREIAARQQQLEQRQSQLKRNSEQLEASRRQRKKALGQLKRQISGGDKRLQRMKSDRQRLQQVLKQLQQTLKKIDLSWESKEFSQFKGKLKWPTKGRVVRSYGSRTDQGIKNEGILISAPMGRQVTAVHHGRVVFADWLRGFGLLIIVDHGNGYMSLYGHNESLLKEVGDWVSTSEKIATVGDSGGLSSTGLYFAIRYKGQPYNPKPWLRRSQG